MPKIQLTATVVAQAQCPEGRSKVDFYDIVITGFILEVRSSGGKTYHLRYRDRHGRLRQHKIGDAKDIPFEKARKAAEKLRSQVVLGEDPAEQRQAVKSVPTLEAFARERYLPHVKGYKRRWDSDEALLRLHLLPKFGHRHLDDIRHQDVVDLHKAKRASGLSPAYANHIVTLLRHMYNLAKKWQVPGAESNPAQGVPLFEPNDARERYLSPEETQRLLDVLERSENPQLKYIVPLLILTGARKRELLDARWADFDLPRRSWRIPMSKSGRARHVPLSETVLQLLDTVPRWEGCPYVVPNPKTRLPYRSFFGAWDNARKAAGMPELRLHDLRHSFASFLVNSGRSIYEVQRILGHSQISTTQRYSHLSRETLLQAADAAAGAAGIRIPEE